MTPDQLRSVALITAGLAAGVAVGWFVREFRCNCDKVGP